MFSEIMLKIKHLIEYYLLSLIITISLVFSWTSLPIVGTILSYILFLALPTRRRVAIKNIIMALKTSDCEARKIALSSFSSISTTVLEIAHLGIKYRRSPSRFIRFSRYDVFRKALDAGNGAILLSAHQGNWELMAGSLAEWGYDVWAVVKPQANPYVERLFKRLRERYGVKVIYMEGSARYIIKLLRENKFVAILADQHAGDAGIQVNLFGRKTSTWGQVGRIASITSSPIIIGFDIREKANQHRALIHNLWYIKNVNNVDKLFAKEYNNRLEGFLRKCPGQYLWMHRRWK